MTDEKPKSINNDIDYSVELAHLRAYFQAHQAMAKATSVQAFTEAHVAANNAEVALWELEKERTGTPLVHPVE